MSSTPPAKNLPAKNPPAKNPPAKNPPKGKLPYRLLTGKDDKAFCERVSQALEDGWQLYGEPKMTYDWWGASVKVAQAVVWPDYEG